MHDTPGDQARHRLTQVDILSKAPATSVLATTMAGFVIAGSWLIAQDAQGPERWEEAIQQFEAADRESPPAPSGVVFVGSSSIRGWKTLADDFPGIPTLNRGFGGSQISDSIHFFDRIIAPYRPSQIVLYAGDNDIAKGKTPETVAKDFRHFVRQLQQALPETRVAFIAIKPSLKRWEMVNAMRNANKAIQQFCESDPRLDYVDIFTPMLGADGKPRPELFVDDGLHLTREGYLLWTQVLKPFLIDPKSAP